MWFIKKVLLAPAHPRQTASPTGGVGAGGRGRWPLTPVLSQDPSDLASRITGHGRTMIAPDFFAFDLKDSF